MAMCFGLCALCIVTSETLYAAGECENFIGDHPEWIFCDRDRLPPAPEPPWPGNWKWVVYEVTDPNEARDLASRGIAFVETMAVREMLADLGSAGGGS